MAGKAPHADPRAATPSTPSLARTYDMNEAQFGKPFIAISGLIGAGKTTLATALGEALDLPIFYEPVIDNVYLTDFYGDMARYAFPLQVFLLNKRFAQQQRVPPAFLSFGAAPRRRPFSREAPSAALVGS